MTDSLAGLSTEQSDPRYREIDRLSTEQVARLMNTADATVPAAVAEAIPAISTAIDAIVGRMKRGGRLIYVGAGTSGGWPCWTPPSARRPSAPTRNWCRGSSRAASPR
nr:hypothetical protein GCM10020093_014200 [Planobispora longispora]